jgi:uncharacterized RDD family membrane protein YckC
MACAGCGIAFEGEYCPDCGTPAGLSGKAKPDTSLISLRGCAYLIDAIAGALVSFGLSWLPFAGIVLSGFVLAAWWLLRDIPGASPGKRLFGLTVVRQDGSPADKRARILRNITLIPGPLVTLIPLGGLFTGPALAIGLLLVEIGFLLVRHERLGDRIAGTMVIRK